jgi:medium-chain acyl-[acyl-carrier-protein] hydrolase
VTRENAVWSETFRVRASEVDAGGHASVEAICDWLQEAAGNHAASLGWAVDDLLPRGLTWVLVRLRLELHRVPAWKETVEVTTWPSGVDRAWALRDFRLRDGDGRDIGSAGTAWAILDLASRRPVPPPSEVTDAAVGTPGRLFEGPIERLPEPAGAPPRRPIEVRFADLDMNRHANNVRVIGWVLQGLPDEVRPRRLARLDVEFRAEALLGDALVSEAVAAGDATFLHRVVRPADGKEIARARSSWT